MIGLQTRSKVLHRRTHIMRLDNGRGPKDRIIVVNGELIKFRLQIHGKRYWKR